MRELREIAFEIETHWKSITNRGAQEALIHMKQMGDIGSPYGADSTGHSVVGSFLLHAVGWRGEVARRVKKRA